MQYYRVHWGQTSTSDATIKFGMVFECHQSPLRAIDGLVHITRAVGC